MLTAGVQAQMVAVLRSQVLVVDDHPLFRAGLAQLLSQEPDLEVVGEAGNAADAVSMLRRDPVDVVVLDVLIPSTSGISLAAQLLEVRTCKVLALSVLDEPVMIAAMLRAGASGYALKTQPPQEIIEAIRLVLTGGRYLPPRAAREEVLARINGAGDMPLQRLTRREREIFDLLIRGYTNDEIGTRLFIARRTVETHRQRIMKKLATHSIVDMIRLAARQGALAE